MSLDTIAKDLNLLVTILYGTLIGVVCLGALIFIYKNRDRVLFLLTGDTEIRYSFSEFLKSTLTCCGLCSEPLAMKDDLEDFLLRIEDITIGNCPLEGSDVFISVSAGVNPTFNTRVHHDVHGDIVHFEEVFMISLRKCDSSVQFKILDEDIVLHDLIAKLEIDADDFIVVAEKNPSGQRYSRFDLKLADGSENAMPGKKKKKSSSKKDRSAGLDPTIRPWISFKLSMVPRADDSRNAAELKAKLLDDKNVDVYKLDNFNNLVI